MTGVGEGAGGRGGCLGTIVGSHRATEVRVCAREAEGLRGTL